MAGDVRLTQLARILGLGSDQTNETAVKAAVSSRPAELGAALFEEAVASDDVMDEASARAYLAARLESLGELVADGAREAVTREFERRVGAWSE